MNIRKNKSQALAAAKAGISERSARRIERAATLPSQNPRRYWRSRADPFVQVWDSEIVPLLKNAPKLMAITLLRKLQDDHPDRFPEGTLRTLQRHIRQRRALQGPPKEVFFPQQHAPGHRGLSDFTAMGELRITIANAPFAHILYHFVLAFSRWEHVEVVEGGESFQALSNGLQNALWQAGGVPQEHRSDSLSAAFKNRSEQEDFTARYTALLEHYGMVGTRNNRGLSHENGSVESSHRYLKEALEQALLLRGHRDFADRAAYEAFVREAVMRRNRRNAPAFRIEREQLQDLRVRRSTDFVEEEARVTRCGTFTVRAILYSAPSRLIGHRLKVRLYSDRLDCYLSGTLVLTLARGALVGDNYHGRSTTTILAGLTPWPGRSWRRVMVSRSNTNKGSRFARQEDHGPPSAEVQTTPPQAQPGRCRGQGWPERTQRPAHRNQRSFALAARNPGLAHPHRPADYGMGQRGRAAARIRRRA